MKKKFILYGLVWGMACAVSLGASGCQKSENYQLMEESKGKTLPIYEEKELEGKESALAGLRDVYKSGYTCEEWTGTVSAGVEVSGGGSAGEGMEASGGGSVDEGMETSGGGSAGEGALHPGGILCGEDWILISDRKNNCILKTDYAGNLIKRTGETGSGEGQFQSPGAIAGYGGYFYIIDQGNDRIQVLDKELEYAGEIKLKDTKGSDPDYRPGTLAVGEEGIYVGGFSLRNPVIDRYEEGNDKRAEAIGDNFIGAVSAYGGRIYAVNSSIRYYDKENDSFGALSNCPEWLFNIEGTALKERCELPYGLYITAFVMDGDGIIGCSGAAGAVFALGKDGKYKETIAYIPGLEEEELPQISGNGQEYYIAMPKAGKIYRCYRGE